MPSYDRRKQELKARFHEAQATMNPIEIVRLAGVLENFNSTRDGVLTTIVTLASDESEDEEMLEAMVDVFEMFVGTNRGRFLGPVSSETERALLRPDSWEELEAGLVGLGLDQKLRQWRASTLEVTSRITDAFTQVQSSFASLPIELQDGARRGVNEQWEKAISAVRAATDDAAKALEAAEKTAGAEQVKQDLNRSALAAQLRA